MSEGRQQLRAATLRNIIDMLVDTQEYSSNEQRQRIWLTFGSLSIRKSIVDAIQEQYPELDTTTANVIAFRVIEAAKVMLTLDLQAQDEKKQE